MYSADPIVYVVTDFINEHECDAFISAARGKLKPSTVISDEKFISHQARTSENCWLEHDSNEVVHEVSKRLSILVQMPIRNAEQYQIVYYGPGSEYKPHFDSFDINTKEGKKNWEPGGQRILTVLAYLNDVEEGGGTGFPNLDFEVKPKKGDVLVFHNTLKDSTEIHPNSLHAGLPVVSGEKWAINLWFRERIRY